jgi:hypothetical protein
MRRVKRNTITVSWNKHIQTQNVRDSRKYVYRSRGVFSRILIVNLFAHNVEANRCNYGLSSHINGLLKRHFREGFSLWLVLRSSHKESGNWLWPWNYRLTYSYAASDLLIRQSHRIIKMIGTVPMYWQSSFFCHVKKPTYNLQQSVQPKDLLEQIISTFEVEKIDGLAGNL